EIERLLAGHEGEARAGGPEAGVLDLGEIAARRQRGEVVSAVVAGDGDGGRAAGVGQQADGGAADRVAVGAAQGTDEMGARGAGRRRARVSRRSVEGDLDDL